MLLAVNTFHSSVHSTHLISHSELLNTTKISGINSTILFLKTSVDLEADSKYFQLFHQKLGLAPDNGLCIRQFS